MEAYEFPVASPEGDITRLRYIKDPSTISGRSQSESDITAGSDRDDRGAISGRPQNEGDINDHQARGKNDGFPVALRMRAT